MHTNILILVCPTPPTPLFLCQVCCKLVTCNNIPTKGGNNLSGYILQTYRSFINYITIKHINNFSERIPAFIPILTIQYVGRCQSSVLGGWAISRHVGKHRKLTTMCVCVHANQVITYTCYRVSQKWCTSTGCFKIW